MVVIFENDYFLSEMIFELLDLFVPDFVPERMIFLLYLGKGGLILRTQRPVHSILKYKCIQYLNINIFLKIFLHSSLSLLLSLVDFLFVNHNIYIFKIHQKPSCTKFIKYVFLKYSLNFSSWLSHSFTRF